MDLNQQQPSSSTYYVTTSNSYEQPTTSATTSSSSSLYYDSVTSKGYSIGSMLNPTQHMQQAKEHPAVVQADQMNAYMDTYFVDHLHQPSTSASSSSGTTVSTLSRMVVATANGDEEDFVDNILDDPKDTSDSLFGQKHGQTSAGTMTGRIDGIIQIVSSKVDGQQHGNVDEQKKDFLERKCMKVIGMSEPHAVIPSSYDPELLETKSKAAARKAEAARQRYHSMTAEERRQYNMRRTEALRRRRKEEEELLSTPAGNISAEALRKAQQVLARNRRKAAMSRQRYSNMSAEERKLYNQKRAAAKRERNAKKRIEIGMGMGMDHTQQQQQHFELNDMNDMDDISSDEDDNMSHASSLLNPNYDGQPQQAAEMVVDKSKELIGVPKDEEEVELKDEVKAEEDDEDLLNDIFEQMEREVTMRTQQAQKAIQRRSGQFRPYMSTSMAAPMPEMKAQQKLPSLSSQTLSSTFLVSSASTTYESAVVPTTSTSIATTTPTTYLPAIDQEFLLEGSQMISGQRMAQQQQQQQQQQQTHQILQIQQPSTVVVQKEYDQSQLIDEKSLHQMLITGVDANGQPVDIRLADGTPLNGTEQLSSLGSGQTLMITHVPMDKAFRPNSHQIYDHMLETGEYSDGRRLVDYSSVNEMEMKRSMSRARRAERARKRYHNMNPEVRQLQNAKRAEMLRMARARDEKLIHLGETVAANNLDEETQKQIMMAQQRRTKRAEQARAKYHRMNSEERRQYNAMRDAQRRQRRRAQERRNNHQLLDQSGNSLSGDSIMDQPPPTDEKPQMLVQHMNMLEGHSSQQQQQQQPSQQTGFSAFETVMFESENVGNWETVISDERLAS